MSTVRFQIFQVFLALAAVSGVAAQDAVPVAPPARWTVYSSVTPSPEECCEKAAREAWDEGDAGSALRSYLMAVQLGLQKTADDHLAACDQWLFGYARKGQNSNPELESRMTVPVAPKRPLTAGESAAPSPFLLPTATLVR